MIDNEKTLLLSLLKIFSMFQMSLWYDKEPDDQIDLKSIAIRYMNRGKETGSSMNNMNTNYKYIITSFVLNEVLDHVGMSWIIETHKQLKYDMDKHNTYWIAGGP